jgi:hypothetical protein
MLFQNVNIKLLKIRSLRHRLDHRAVRKCKLPLWNPESLAI